MISDRQVRRVIELRQKTKVQAADKAGMDVKSARKYVRLGKMPSEVKAPRMSRTRKDPFDEVWETVKAKLLESEGMLEGKTLFEHLQRGRPGTFRDVQLRTPQRRIKRWRALEGPTQEVFSPQVYRPGVLCESDFTRMGTLEITIGEESAYVEVKLALSKRLQETRRKKNLSQEKLARHLMSSQSRVGKMESGDPAVSLDLLVRSLLALGASRKTLARMLA